MAKKIEMTKDESILFNELKKLAKTANQRILRLERLTGLEKPFAVKELSDYLSVSQINGMTKGGRVKASKSMTLEQMKMSIKALQIFLKEDISKVAGVKKARKEVGKMFDIPEVSFEQANAYYQSFGNYTWIYEFMTESDFWQDFGNPARFGWTQKESFVESLSFIIEKSDIVYRKALENLYDYCRWGSNHEILY